jgi:hypothetical protein
MFDKNKKASELLTSAIVFIIAVLLFIAMLSFFISRTGKMAPIYEQLYSKQIVLIIDKAIPGTNISLDITKLYEVTDDNKYSGDMINIDNELNVVHVKLANGKGYSYKFFNNNDISWNIKENEKRLYINVLGNSLDDGELGVQ